MKRFLKKLVPFAAWILFLMVLLPVAIDPYNVFHGENLRDNGIEPNKNFLKTEYVIHHPEQFDSFLFGSSRVSSIHSDRIQGYRCYNMTYSEGLPAEHLTNLRVMLEHGIKPRMVMVGVDSISFMVAPALHYDDRLRCPYPVTRQERQDFYLRYLEPIMAVQSLKTTFFEPRVVAYDQRMYQLGWSLDYGVESSTDWSQAKPDWDARYANRTPEVLEEIRQLKKLCDENDIQLVIFTNPMHPMTYEMAVDNGYREFLEGLAQITDYYNFSGLNDITLDNANYLETSHYKPHVGDRMLDVMFGGPADEGLLQQGFGIYVTKENCSAFLENVLHL